jgi:hypothetical protein
VDLESSFTVQLIVEEVFLVIDVVAPSSFRTTPTTEEKRSICAKQASEKQLISGAAARERVIVRDNKVRRDHARRWKRLADAI